MIPEQYDKPQAVPGDPWGNTSVEANPGVQDATQQDDPHSHLGQDDGPLDVEANEVAKQRKSVLMPLLIGGVAISALVVVGVAAQQLYRKISPASPESSRAVVEAPLTPAAPAPAATLPAPTLPADTASGVVADVAMPGTQIGRPPPSSAAAVAVAVATAASVPNQMAPAPAAAVSPAAPTAVAQNSTEPPKVQRSQDPSPSKKVTAAPARDYSRSSVDPATVAAEHPKRRTQVASAAGSKPVKSGRRQASTKGRASAVATGEDAERIETARLSGWRLESIDPKYGEFQLAWVRTPTGTLRVVTVGDALDGARVTRVDGAAYAVQTTQGLIK